jgi:PAS domain S-box-containing protein
MVAGACVSLLFSIREHQLYEVMLPVAAVLLGSAWWVRRGWRDLREREQWLATALRSIDDGVITTDEKGCVALMNKAAQALTGWSEMEARGRPISEVFQPLRRETREPVESVFQRALREDRRVSAPDPRLLVARNGIEHLVTGKAAPIHTGRGVLRGVAVVLSDVTQSELGEQALRASQEMFRVISDNVSDFIAVLDLRARFLYASGSYRDLLPSRDAFYLSSSFDCLHPEDRERMTAIFHEVVKTGEDRRAEVRLVQRDGKIVQLESVSRLIRDANGKPEKVLVVSRDITERRRAAERMRREMEFTDTLINSLPGIFYLYDARRKILRWNKNFETLSGYSAEEIGSLDPLTYFTEEEKALVHERMLHCFTTGSADIEVNIRSKSGRLTPFYVTGVRLTVDGQPCMLGIGIDISARLAAEHALQEAHANLERKVEARTRDLALANDRLKELDRLKSEFLATMSHELRTPLNSIIGFTGILRQGLAGPLNDEQKKQLGMVQFSARHLLGLINDLLDLSRIESGRMEIVREDFKVADVVGEVTESLAPLAAQKNIRLETKLDDPALVLHSDRKKCFQILLNLANNAVKFTEKGRVEIAVSSSPEETVFSVTDTGIGIRPESMRHLFEAFRQVDGSARRVYEGTGLGLYLCKQLASMLGGSMVAESELGTGSRFGFHLPVSTPDGLHP